jgi:tetratricopeptide (TPR) repeat protein
MGFTELRSKGFKNTAFLRASKKQNKGIRTSDINLALKQNFWIFAKRHFSLKRKFLTFIFALIPAFYAVSDGFNSIARTNAALRKAETAMKEKNYRSAVSAYEEALKENPNLPAQTKLNLGHAYYETGQNRLAQKNYLAALNGLSSPSQKSNACLQLGNLFVKEKNYKTALEWFQKSLLQSPENKIARQNFELAWHQNKKKEEEEQKKNPERNQNQDKNNSQQKQDKQDNRQNKPDQNQSGQGKNTESQQNPNKPGNQKREQDNQKEDPKNPDSKKPEPKKPEEEKQGESKEEEKDEGGKESRKKTDESNSEDPDAFRLDRQKLKESGLNEEQAKNMLQAMRQNEVKYLQQRRFKGKGNARGKSGPRW